MIKWNIKDIGIIYTYETQDKLKLYDSDKEYIGYVEIGNKTTNEIIQILNDLVNINHISDIVNLGFCFNMMYNIDKEDLEDQFMSYGFENGYFEEKYEEISCERYLELLKDFDLNINRVGNHYFIVEYNEYY